MRLLIKCEYLLCVADMELLNLNGIIQCTITFLAPVIILYLSKDKNMPGFFSPIVLCFAVGIVLRNFHLIVVQESLANWIRDISILCALPMLLFSSDVRKWRKQSGQLLKSFIVAVVAGVAAILISFFILKDMVKDLPVAAAMMAGIHTGGTPNLFAVGIALEAEDTMFTLVNSAQIFGGALYLLFILSVGQSFYQRFLRKFDSKDSLANDKDQYVMYGSIRWPDVFKAFTLVAIIIGLSIGLSFFLMNRIQPTFIIIVVTTLGIIASSFSMVNRLKGPFEVGDYMLLVFGVAVGMMSDFAKLLESGGSMITFIILIFLLTVLFQIILSRILDIDADHCLVASTAAIYGPVFIPQVTRAIRNKSLLLGGITISLIGLALGNYVGLSLYYFIMAIS